MRGGYWLPAAVIVILLSVAAVPFVGLSGLLVPGVLLLLLMVRIVGATRGSWPTRLALGTGMLGGVVGFASAVDALVRVGGTPLYSGRVAFGVVALLCAVLAMAAAVFGSTHRALAIGSLIGGSLIGAAAISLFYIDTFYLLAVPLWWVAAFLLLLPNGGSDTSSSLPPPRRT